MDEFPYALLHPEETKALPPLEQVPLLWLALEFVKAQRGQGVYAKSDLDRNELGLSHALGAVWFKLRNELRDEGAWKDLEDPRWPMNYTGDDADHLYKSGVYPPAMLVRDPPEWADHTLSVRSLRRLREEFLVWADTAVGRYTLQPGVKSDVDAHFDDWIRATVDAERAKLDFDMHRIYPDEG